MFNLILFDVHENFLFSLTPEGKDWVHQRKRNISKKTKKKNVLKPLGDSHEMLLNYKKAALYFTTIMTEKIDRYSSIQKLS